MKRQRITKSATILSAVLTAALILAAATTTYAQGTTSLSLSLDTPGSTLTGETGPFGTYSISLQDAGQATLTVTAAPGWKVGGNGDWLWIKFNIAPTGGLVPKGDGIDISSTGSQYLTSGAYAGYTLYTIPTGYSAAYNQIVFKISNNQNTWNSVYDVITAGSEAWSYFYKVADNGVTKGYAMAPVPEPSSFALAGLGLAGLLIFRRRKA